VECRLSFCIRRTSRERWWFNREHYTIEPVPKPQANLRTTTPTANLQENLTAKAPNAAPETLRALYNYTTRRGADKGPAFLFKHQCRGTEGAEGLYRQPRLLSPIRLFYQLSRLLVKPIGYQISTPLSLFASAVY
jgi:hypothetical protein